MFQTPPGDCAYTDSMCVRAEKIHTGNGVNCYVKGIMYGIAEQNVL